jgi:cytochrome c oxidase subunit II
MLDAEKIEGLMMKHKSKLVTLWIAMFLAGSLASLPSRAEHAPRRIEVIAKRYEFSPAEITLKEGQPVTVVLKSMDVAHGQRFKELGVEIHTDKGQTSQVSFTPDKTGTFVGHCSVFCGSGHGTMTLTLHVVDSWDVSAFLAGQRRIGTAILSGRLQGCSAWDD